MNHLSRYLDGIGVFLITVGITGTITLPIIQLLPTRSARLWVAIAFGVTVPWIVVRTLRDLISRSERWNQFIRIFPLSYAIFLAIGTSIAPWGIYNGLYAIVGAFLASTVLSYIYVSFNFDQYLASNV